MSKKVWIGLVNLVPNEGNTDLGEGKGAFVNVLTYAENEEDFNSLVKFAAYEHNYSIHEVKDVELFDERIKSFEVEGDLIDLAEKVRSTKKTCFGEFYVYKNKDEVD